MHVMIEKLLKQYSRHLEFLGEDLIDVHQIGVFGSQVLHLAAFAGHREDVGEILAGADLAAERWREFKSIQEANFKI